MKLERFYTHGKHHVAIISGINLGRGLDSEGFYVCEVKPDGKEGSLEQAHKAALLFLERLTGGVVK